MQHYYDLTSFKRNGLTVPAPGIAVTVYLQGTLTKASLFSDDGITATTNPVFSDQLGRFDFYIAVGRYDLAFSGPGVNSFTQFNVEILDATDTTGLGKTPIAFTANNTHSGIETFSGALGIPNGTPVPALCSVGQFFFDTAAQALNVCTSTNTWTAITSTTGTGVANIWSALQTFNGGAILGSPTIFKGPNPYVDITAFGARAGNPGTTPYQTGLTATCSSGQAQVTISSASSFVNGDGVVLYGCGAVHSMSTPGAPTVTNVLAAVGTGTGLVTTAAPVGAITTCYKVVAADKGGGLTAASAETCTTTGNALGAQTVNITSMARANNVVTVTTAATHGFLVGCNITTCGEVFIGSGNGLTDASFYGWYRVATAPNGTTFTFSANPDTRLGAPAASTGGTAQWFAANHITWSAVTGAVRYYIYGGATGAETLIGSSNIEGPVNTDLTFDDFGSTYLANFKAPPYVPNAFPTAATSDNLSTTITSGAGTTTLTLANAAGTTCPSASCPATVSIRLDAAPAILAAATAINANGGQGTLYIPSSPGNSFVINSYLDTSGLGFAVSQNGTLQMNETWQISPSGGGVEWFGDLSPQWGAVGVGSWRPNVHINVNTANPGIYVSNGTSAHFRGLDINSIANSGNPNNARLMLVEGSFNQTYENMFFSTGTGGDLSGICLYLRGAISGGSSNVIMDRVAFAPGAQNNTHAPSWFSANAGTTTIRSSYSVHRGAVINNGGLVVQHSYMNGGGTPFFTQAASLQGWSVILGSIVMDTFAHPCLANLSSFNGTVNFTNGACAPSSVGPGAAPAVTGFPSVVVNGVTPTSANSCLNSTFGNAVDGTFNTGAGQNYALANNNCGLSIGNGYEVFIDPPPMAQPTCAVSAGGTLTVGNYQFQLVPMWQNGGLSRLSVLSTICTTSGGNQTITINWTGASGFPKDYRIYESGVRGFGYLNTTGLAGSTSFVSTGATGIITGTFPQMSAGGPTMMMPGVQGLATTQLTVAGAPFVSATPPTISTHFNTSGDSISATTTATFLITVGNGAGTSTGAITLPAAPNGWNCELSNKNRAATIQQTGDTATTATFTNFGTTFAATNWTNGDTLYGSCFPR